MILLLLSVAFAYTDLKYSPERVKTDIRSILSNDAADDGNYGPFLIRLAWHCAGTYRRTDGRGGCDGARIRFDVERSWDDNKGLIPGPHHNLPTITALELLYPIKKKYGLALSWGDLIVLAGNTAIEAMDGPEMDFCGGRVDSYEGYSLEELDVNLIYVNAGNTSAADVREKFDRMDMNDQETVALIGGGHSFGRCHAQISGFDGQWTANPSQFDNQYFQFLLQNEYMESDSISGQFDTTVGQQTYIMVHGDMVLLDDPEFSTWVNIYANDIDALFVDFKAAWEKLMNRDMGLRPCAGVIPQIENTGIDYDSVKRDVIAILPDNSMDYGTWGPLMVRLAWHCAGTYRSTDHIGGCNGARIRHAPEANWGSNIDVDLALGRLEPIYDRYQPGLSWADLIIIAGTGALESMGALPMPFCPGRVDVTAEVAAEQSKNLNPEIYLEPASATISDLRESMAIMGFTDRDMVVLNGGGHSIGQCHHFRSGFDGPWTVNPNEIDNGFFVSLLEREWLQTTSPQGKKQFHDRETRSLTMLVTDLIFRDDDKFRAIVEEYAQDNDLFLSDFRDAWVKLVNADRFGDVCVTSSPTIESTAMESTAAPSVAVEDANNMHAGDAAYGPVTVNCNTEPANVDTSSIEWFFVVTLLIIIASLLCLLYVLVPRQESEFVVKSYNARRKNTHPEKNTLHDITSATSMGGLTLSKKDSWKIEMPELKKEDSQVLLENSWDKNPSRDL